MKPVEWVGGFSIRPGIPGLPGGHSQSLTPTTVVFQWREGVIKSWAVAVEEEHW